MAGSREGECATKDRREKSGQPACKWGREGGREGSPGGKSYPGRAIRGLKKAINGLKLYESSLKKLTGIAKQKV